MILPKFKHFKFMNKFQQKLFQGFVTKIKRTVISKNQRDRRSMILLNKLQLANFAANNKAKKEERQAEEREGR